MHVVEAQTVFRQGIHMGGPDRAAVTAKLPETDIIQDDKQDVWRPLLRALGSGQACWRCRTCAR